MKVWGRVVDMRVRGVSISKNHFAFMLGDRLLVEKYRERKRKSIGTSDL